MYSSRMAKHRGIVSNLNNALTPHPPSGPASSWSGFILVLTYALAICYAFFIPKPMFTYQRSSVLQFDLEVEICGAQGSATTVLIANEGLCLECEGTDLNDPDDGISMLEADVLAPESLHYDAPG